MALSYDFGRARSARKFRDSVLSKPRWEVTEMELCDILGRKHLGGPGRPDCAGEIEIKDRIACVTRSGIIAEAQKGRKMIVAKCFSQPAIEEARNRGLQLVQFKRLAFGKTTLRIA
jgi:hypothetical protein